MAVRLPVEGQQEDSPLATVRKLTGKDTRALIADLEDKYKKCKDQRWFFERQWYLNMAFYFGRHYVQWLAPVSGAQNVAGWTKLHEPAAPPWRVRLVINRIRSHARKEMAKLVKEKPQGFVVPATMDEVDVAAAKAGESISEYIFQTQELNKILRRTVFWTVICGTGFVKDWWDITKTDPNGIPGEIRFEPLSPLHVYVPDLQEEELENQPYIIHAMAKSPEWVAASYKKDNISADSYAGGDALEQKFQTVMGLHSPEKNMVNVKEAWLKPTKKYPRGLYVTWTKDEILQMVEQLPYAHNEYPFTKIDNIPSGRFYGDSVIADMIPLQRELNRTRSQIIEAKNRMAKPQLLAPIGSINPNKVTTEPGLIIQYRPGFEKPTPLPLQPLPNYVIEEVERCKTDMEDVGFAHELPRGGVVAATAISFIQEEDDTALAPAISSVEEGVQRLGRHALSHVNQFWYQERKIQVVGFNREIESFIFSRSDIRGNTDFRVEAGSAAPRSQAAKQAFITELMKNGWIFPNQGLKYLGMAETARLHDESQKDANQAQRENLRMSQGEGAQRPIDPMTGEPMIDPMTGEQMEPVGIPINPYDNNVIHIIEHMNYQKKQEYERLDPELKLVFDKHVKLHQVALMEEAQGMALPKPMEVIPGQQVSLSPVQLGTPAPPAQPQTTPGGVGGPSSTREGGAGGPI